MASVLVTAVGHQLADMPMILAGIDPCFSCNDRTVVVADAGGAAYNWEQIRHYGIAFYQGK
jgi:NADH-quinone oxidoreductase subunit D